MTEEFKTCPKCGAESGDSWSQCKGSCPMPGSPYYTPDYGNSALIREQDARRPGIGAIIRDLLESYPRWPINRVLMEAKAKWHANGGGA